MLSTRPDQRTLLCILDWGLGHASRSLALANALEEAGEAVFFASCGRAKTFIETERPGTVVYELPGYNVTYPTRFMPLNVALQFPRWMVTIWRERRCCATLVEELRIDRIVSDNRFGCYAPGTRSVFLTHQLHPITNSRLVSSIYRAYLQRFDEFWVPDYSQAEDRISGKLSATKGYGQVDFIGPLSRLSAGVTEQQKRGAPKFCVMALLSGPEPMRTQLEAIVVAQLSALPGNHVLVRGLPGSANPLPGLPDNITVHDFADAALLSRLLPAAEHIICRSGYSTLMDVYAVTMGKKLILVPTPGQTEQVYLAKREATRIGCVAVLRQEDLELGKILAAR